MKTEPVSTDPLGVVCVKAKVEYNGDGSSNCGRGAQENYYLDDVGNEDINGEECGDLLISISEPSFCSTDYHLIKSEEKRLDTNIYKSSSSFLTEERDEPSPMQFLNEIGEETDEIERIITDTEHDNEYIEVKDIKPVAIPIPIVAVTSEQVVNKPKDIIISHRGKGESRPRRKKQVLRLCTVCNTGFPNSQLLQEHMTIAHADLKPFKCKHCKKGFSTKLHRKVHETIHNANRFKGEPKFSCDMCDKKYHLKVSLNGHRRVEHFGYKKPKKSYGKLIVKHHHSTAGVKNHRKPVQKLFKCPHCDLKFDMRCILLKHMGVHTKERNYECTVCGQRLSSKTVLRSHMKNRHINPTEKTQTTPHFMKNQIWPCSVCEKEFKVASQLKKHMTLHTEEKTYECTICKKRFRILQDFNTHTKRVHRNDTGFAQKYHRFKCLLCGKANFSTFTDFRNHRRTTSHSHIPYDSEKEKPFGCGICGKPYFLKINAVICALLRHDPTSLQNAMFKIKCPVCPEERLGYHSALALKRHWDVEHSELPFPVKYRAACGMYEKSSNRHDTLPSVKLNTEAVKNIKDNGPPEVKYEYPLFHEFDLFQVDLKKVKKPSKPKQKKPSVKSNHKCEICGVTIAYSRNFERHVQTHSKDKQISWPHTCNICNKGFQKVKSLHIHERLVHKMGIKKSGRKPGRPKKAQNSQEMNNKALPFFAHIPDKIGIKRRVGRPRKLPLLPEKDSSTTSTVTFFKINKFSRVNVKDRAAINQLLGNRYISIDIYRIL